MDKLPRVTLSGDLEGDYVVLAERAGGVLKIAAAQPDGPPVVVALEKTCTACPALWEGSLEDGRTVYARYRGGALSVGVGAGVDEAVHNSMSEEAFYFDHVGDGFDGFMNFEELKTHLYGLLEFGADLEAENEREPSFDLEAFERIFPSEESADPDPARKSSGGEGAPGTPERVGAGLREAEIQDWTCFSCGDALTQAHEGDYFHTDDNSECTNVIPVPMSLVQQASQAKS